MDEHLSLMSVHAKPSAPGETDVDAREVGRLVCGRKEDDRGEKREGRTGNESPAPLRPAGGKLDLFAKVCRIFFLSVVRFTLLREESRGVEDFTEASASHKMPTVCQQNNSVTFNIVMRGDASKIPASPRSSSGYND